MNSRRRVNSTDRRDRAAPLAGRLAAGVGRRVALPRNVAGRVGQTQLDHQTGFVAAQPGRVAGYALVATQETGGQNVSEPAVWHPNAAETSRLHLDCCLHAGAGHGRKLESLHSEGIRWYSARG